MQTVASQVHQTQSIARIRPPARLEEQVPCLGPESELRILGSYISPLGKPELQYKRLGELLEIVANSPVEPYNKVEIIRNHLVFKFRFQVVYGGVGLTDAVNADKLMRKYLRKILDLPRHTAEAFFHIPRSKGGLGIERLEFAATYLRKKTEFRLLRSEREVTSESISLAKVRDGYLHLSRDAGRQEEGDNSSVNWLTTSAETLLRHLKEIDIEEWYLD